MKKIIAAIILFVVLVGGGYYYWEIYRVPQAAVDLVIIYQKDFGGVMRKLESSRPKDSDDYAPILAGIAEVTDELNGVEKKLSAMWLPSKLKEMRVAMLEMVHTLQGVLARVKAQAEFMDGFADIIRTLSPRNFEKTFGPNATVGDMVNYWGDAIPRLKSDVDALFAGEAVALNGITFEELKSKWLETRDDFDTILVLMRAQNQKNPLRDFRMDDIKMSEREKADFQEVGTFIDDFVEKTISANDAYDLIGGSGNPLPKQLEDKSSNLQKAFQKFSEEYPDIVKQIEAEAQKRGLKP